MVSKVVFVVILAVVSGTRAFEDYTRNLDDVDNQIHAAVKKVDQALKKSELNENELIIRFDGNRKIQEAIHKAFETQNAAAKGLRDASKRAQEIFDPLRETFEIAENVEKKVKNQIDEARKIIEKLLKEANTRDSNTKECAVESAEPFEEIAKTLYQNAKQCLISRIDSMTDSQTNLVDKILLTVHTVTNANTIITNCVQGLNDNPSWQEVSKAKICLAKADKNLDLVPVMINMDVIKLYAAVQKIKPVLNDCATATATVDGADISVLSVRVGLCLL